PARLEVAQEIGEAEAAGADAFDDEHVLPFERLVEVLSDADDPGGGHLPVRNDRDEIDRRRPPERAPPGRPENGGGPEHAGQVEGLVGVVRRDLCAQPRHLRTDRRLVQQDLADAVAGSSSGSHQPNRLALMNSRDCATEAALTAPVRSHSSKHCEIVRIAWSAYPLEPSSSRPPCSRSIRMTRSLTTRPASSSTSIASNLLPPSVMMSSIRTTRSPGAKTPSMRRFVP